LGEAPAYVDLLKIQFILSPFTEVPKQLLQGQNIALVTKMLFMWHNNQRTCDLMLQEEQIQKLIHATNLHFDLLIVEAFFNECFLGFVHKFKAPLIQLCAFGGAHWIGDWVGNPNPYAYVPDPFLSYRDKMNFWERMINTLVGTAWRLGRAYFYLPGQDAIMRKHFNDYEDLPSLAAIEYTTSLVLLNHHFSISFPRPLMPNMVQVGGMHLRTPKKLPQV
jgi:glucuronosyltransferase